LDLYGDRLCGGRKREGLVKNPVPGLPLVSIITVVKNKAASLSRAIEEVRTQTYPNREHVIIDGGSTDGTVEILRDDREIDFWISEPDRGIYEAMDRGIEASDGEWLYFMGVDDAFSSPDMLSSVFGGGHDLGDRDLIVGNVLTDTGLFRGRFTRALYFKNTVHHQGVFYRGHIFDRFRYCGSEKPGLPGPCYTISGDYRLNLMLFRRGAASIYLDRTIALCGRGISMEGRFTGYWEEILIRHEQIGFLRAVFFDLFTLLRYVLRKVR